MAVLGEAQRIARRERRRSAFGLRSPNPAMARLLPKPLVLDATLDADYIPTVTVGTANAASTITSSVIVAATNGAFRYMAGHYLATTVSGYTAKVRDDLTTNSAPQTVRVDWMADDDVIEIFVSPSSTAAKFLIYVEGRPVATTFTASAFASAGAVYFVKLTFTDRRNRHIRFDGTAIRFLGGTRGPNGTFWKAKTPIGPRVIFPADSFGEGTGADWHFTSIPFLVGEHLGWLDTWNSGLGGTGYLNPGVSPRVALPARIVHDVTDQAPDIVIPMLGYNDVAYPTGPTFSAANEEAAVLGVFEAIKATGAILIAVSNFSDVGGANQQVYVVGNAIESAAATAGADLFIDAVVGSGLGWITGQGNVGAATGTGNADLYVGSDSVHFNQAGYDYTADRIASEIAAWMDEESVG